MMALKIWPMGATISHDAPLHMWAEARKVNIHHILKHYTNNKRFKYVKIAKKCAGTQMYHIGRKRFQAFDKGIRVPVQ
jgi:hypothetical protein